MIKHPRNKHIPKAILLLHCCATMQHYAIHENKKLRIQSEGHESTVQPGAIADHR
jgi:hypothetical protein